MTPTAPDRVEEIKAALATSTVAKTEIGEFVGYTRNLIEDSRWLVAEVELLRHIDKLYQDVCEALPMVAGPEDEAADVVKKLVTDLAALRQRHADVVADRDALHLAIETVLASEPTMGGVDIAVLLDALEASEARKQVQP